MGVTNLLLFSSKFAHAKTSLIHIIYPNPLSTIQMHMLAKLLVKYYFSCSQLLHSLTTTSRTEVMRGNELRVLVGLLCGLVSYASIT